MMDIMAGWTAATCHIGTNMYVDRTTESYVESQIQETIQMWEISKAIHKGTCTTFEDTNSAAVHKALILKFKFILRNKQIYQKMRFEQVNNIHFFLSDK